MSALITKTKLPLSNTYLRIKKDLARSFSMDYQQEEKNGYKILKCQGRLDSSSAPTFESDLAGFIESGHDQLILDFTNLDYIASAGLRVVLATAKRLKAKETGKFGLCGLNENVTEVFEVSGFTSILKIFKDQKTAIENL